MIEIKKTQDIKVYEEFGFPNDSVTVAMAATEKGEVFGAGAVTLKDGYAVLLEPRMKDGYKMFNMEFGMGKALLNMLDLSGIQYVFCDISDERLAKSLRFKENSEIPDEINPDREYRYFLSLKGYFTQHHCEGE